VEGLVPWLSERFNKRMGYLSILDDDREKEHFQKLLE
jgi:hypothetical protein